MYTVTCKNCSGSFTKASNGSTQTVCTDCLYNGIFTKSKNTHAALSNSELTKRQLLNKLNKMDEKMDEIDKKMDMYDVDISETIDKRIEDALSATMKAVANKAALKHSQEFIDLKASIEEAQAKHEARMKTLLATVNSRSIEALKKADDEYEKLGKRVKELRMLAKQEGWKITSSKSNPQS